jgi:hypothetical protein
MMFVRAFQELSSEALGPVPELPRVDVPERVYVRCEEHGGIAMRLWGMEHGGLRSEAVESVVPGRRVAVLAIERDLRRGVGLL